MRKALVLLAFALALPATAQARVDNASNSTSIYFSSAEKIRDIEAPDAPYTTPRAAIDHVLTNPDVLISIHKATEMYGFRKWFAHAKRVPGFPRMWDVMVRTRGDSVPSYQCYFRFDRSGTEYAAGPWTGCDYFWHRD